MIHAITATWAFDEAKKRQALSRRCPKCRSEQIAAEEKINEPVACDVCKAQIPPKAAAKGRMQKNKDDKD